MKKCGVSNGALARKTIVSPSTVGRWLTGAHPQPSVLMRIADALGIRVEWLVDGEGEIERNTQLDGDDGLKETQSPNRLRESPPVTRSRLAFPQALQPPRTPALNLASAKLTDAELEEILTTSLTRLKEEHIPVLKLGYLATLKACVNDLERRLSEGPGE